MLTFKTYDDRPTVGIYWNGQYLGDFTKQEAQEASEDLSRKAYEG